MSIPYDVLPDYDEGMEAAVAKAYSYMSAHKGPYALLVKKNTFSKYDLPPQVTVDYDCTREEVLNIACENFGNTPTVTTTGFTSREMFELREARDEGHGRDFLTVGSMGHCSSIALGMALSLDEDASSGGSVLCIDGDGACMMHMGSMVTAGQSQAKNFKHLLINNGMHDSVGGQPSKGFEVDMVSIAKACGYAQARSVSSRDEIYEAMAELASTTNGPTFLEVKVKGGSRPNLGRPTRTPIQNKQDYMKNIGSA
jgi:phosphonopyruvate decarboxylase